MTDEQFRALRQLILDQNVQIAAMAADIRALKQAVETTDIVYVGPKDIEAEPIDIPDDVRRFLTD